MKKNNTEEKIKIHFAKDLTDKERATFETGIKLGALYHILCGIPINTNENVIKSIEIGIEQAISCQPYVKSVKINLRRENLKGKKENEFDYGEISGKTIEADLVVQFKKVEVKAKIKWIEDFEYPLMYIAELNEL
ncbi:MAG: hypothetical protein KAX33_05680 [Candidatus Lokiarchaeota archaeon]|nr:hypothetical protein [Candidatus Lokiarchaeota archaeon]